jgi:hypothetical protein
VHKLRARANTTNEVLDMLLADEEENEPKRIILGMKEERTIEP